MTFKIGDRVCHINGLTGTIIGPAIRGLWMVRFDSEDRIYTLYSESLSLLNFFMPGDRVRTQNGRVGTVLFSGDVSTQVEFPGSCPRVVPFATNSLELAGAAELYIQQEIANARINRDIDRLNSEIYSASCQQFLERTIIPTFQSNSKETTTMQIGSHAVTDVTRDSVKVGCQTVTREQAKAVLEAMDAVPKSAFTVRKSPIAPDIVRIAGNKERYGNSPYGFWAPENGKWTNTDILINATKDELRDLIAELQKFV